MKRFLASGVAATFLLVSIMVGSAMAHTFTDTTSLSIHKSPSGTTAPGDDVLIYGKLQADHHTCEVDKVIKLKKRRPGPDKLLERDRTDAEGDYSFVRHPQHDMTVYTKFSGTLHTSYGHHHECLPSRSSNLLISVS